MRLGKSPAASETDRPALDCRGFSKAPRARGSLEPEHRREKEAGDVEKSSLDLSLATDIAEGERRVPMMSFRQTISLGVSFPWPR